MKNNIFSFFLPLFILALVTSCKGQNQPDNAKQALIDYPELSIPPRDNTVLSAFSNRKPQVLFFKDKNHVYTDRLSVIEGLNPATFQVISNELIKDNNAVYYLTYPNWKKVPEVHAASLVLLGKKHGYHFLKDKNHAYLYYKPYNITKGNAFQTLKNTDPQHFEKVWKNVYADDKHLYNYQGGVIASFTDVPTKKVFDEDDFIFGETKGDIHQIRIVKSKMKHLGYGIFSDGNEVFSLEWPGVFKNADVVSFELINEAYAKDKNAVYHYGNKRNELDSESFELLAYTEHSSYLKDKNQVYWDQVKLEKADLESFEVLSANYAKDKNRVYFHSFPIKNADVESFHLIKDPEGNPAIAVDKNHIYFLGKAMEGVHPNTILQVTGTNSWLDNEHWYAIIYSEGVGAKLLKGERIKASNLPVKGDYYILDEKVYYRSGGGYGRGREIKGADVESFMVLNEHYTKDKNYVYHEGKPITQWLYIGIDGEQHTCTREAFDLAQKIYLKEISDEEMYGYLEVFTGIKPRKNNEEEIRYLMEEAKYKMYDMGGAEIEEYRLDPNTVQFFSGDDGKDKQFYFRNDAIFTSRSKNTDKFDFETFRNIGTGWSAYKDKNHVYNDDLEIIKADPNTIEPVYKIVAEKKQGQ